MNGSLLLFRNFNFENIADSISGKVIAQFKVKLDGTVSDITFLTQPLGGGAEEEVARVLCMLKNWIPAKKIEFLLKLSELKHLL